MPDIYYNDYLQLATILESQAPESQKHGVHAHDEMLFIIIHQAYELWFKQIRYELDSVVAIMKKGKIDDSSGELGLVVRRLDRVNEIWKLCIAQIDVLETMTSQDFLEFRNFLTPASGFQSVQFKLIEAQLGLEAENRHGKAYYKRTGEGGFCPLHYDQINEAEKVANVKTLLNKWLERMPFLLQNYWTKQQNPTLFWDNYRQLFLNSLNEKEDKTTRLAEFNQIFETEGMGNFSATAMRSALFVELYRDYPIFQLPYQFLTKLVDIDENMSIWRYRHLMMVSRMIGMRVGTGGINKEGKNEEGYLEGSLKRHKIFAELTQLATYFVERRNLPPIPVRLQKELGFKHS